MADVHNLSRQHKEIQELLTKLNSFTTKDEVEKEAFKISMLIGQLAGKINIHLSNEDKFVYPKLKDSPDAKSRQVSENFSKEMGGLITVFAEFKTKYMSSTKLIANSSQFIIELQQLTKSIIKRSEKEEAELYPLLTH
jgi:hemerythrin-like domain-containing protein